MDISKLKPKGDTAKAGKWMVFSPPTAPEEEFECLIAYGVRAYQEELERQFAEVRRNNKGRNLSPEQQSEVRTRARIGTMILDWRNVQQDGSEVKFSANACFDLMIVYPAFEMFVVESAADVRNFQDTPQEESEGAAADAELKSGGEMDA